MTVTIKKTDSIEEMNRKIKKVMQSSSKQKSIKAFDPFKYLGKLKGVFGDGMEYQQKTRNEWNR